MPFLDIFASKIKRSSIKEKPKPKIIVDIHEKNSLVIAELIELGCEVEFKKLEVGDYIADGFIIERKTAKDFLSSMISKRLQNQLLSMKSHEKSVLIIEDFEQRFETNINTNAIRGFLMSVLFNIKIPIIFTEDSQDTAHYLYLLAKRQPKDHISIRAKRRGMKKKELLQFILEGFPGIGPATAKKLLKKFGTIRNIINANKEELEGILGKKTQDFIDLIQHKI